MDGGDEPAAEPDWAKLRHDYENGVGSVAGIAAAAGISLQKLTVIARRQGWTLRQPARARREATGATLARLKGLLQRRLADFDARLTELGTEADAATSERDIRAMNTLVRTLEKVLELERKDRAQRARRRRRHRQFDDAARETLAQRLEALHREWAGPEAEPPPPGGGGGQS
jgi:hypothetical protein